MGHDCRALGNDVCGKEDATCFTRMWMIFHYLNIHKWVPRFLNHMDSLVCGRVYSSDGPTWPGSQKYIDTRSLTHWSLVDPKQKWVTQWLILVEPNWLEIIFDQKIEKHWWPVSLGISIVSLVDQTEFRGPFHGGLWANNQNLVETVFS